MPAPTALTSAASFAATPRRRSSDAGQTLHGLLELVQRRLRRAAAGGAIFASILSALPLRRDRGGLGGPLRLTSLIFAATAASSSSSVIALGRGPGLRLGLGLEGRLGRVRGVVRRSLALRFFAAGASEASSARAGESSRLRGRRDGVRGHRARGRRRPARGRTSRPGSRDRSKNPRPKNLKAGRRRPVARRRSVASFSRGQSRGRAREGGVSIGRCGAASTPSSTFRTIGTPECTSPP